MRVSTVTNTPKSASSLIKLKNDQWLTNQRIAGKVTADCLSLLEGLVKEKTTKSLIELDEIAGDFILKNGCTATFKDYKGFPNYCCISVNNTLVHGVATPYILQDGDMISFDLGATYKGSIADSALTCIFGKPKSYEHSVMNLACEEALFKGISAVRPGLHLGEIGSAIYKSVKSNGFNVITNYGGHSICNHEDGTGMPHAAPFVANQAEPNDGIVMQAGLTLAIEPMLYPKKSFGKTSIGKDGWTVYMNDICNHFEHTIFIHWDHVEIITWRQDEVFLKSNKLYFNGK